MSERNQHTAASMREHMNHRYDDGLHHKHNKYHLEYRLHFRSHPSFLIQPTNHLDANKKINESTGFIREKNLEKIRKRFDKGRFH